MMRGGRIRFTIVTIITIVAAAPITITTIIIIIIHNGETQATH